MSSAPVAAAAPSSTATVTVPSGTSNGTHTNGTNHNRPAKRPNNANRSGGNRKPKQQRTKRERNITEGSTEEVLRCDIDALLKTRREAADGEPEEAASAAAPEADLPEPFTEIQVQVHELSSTGDGLGMVAGTASEQVYVVPFTVPGDTARVKVIRHVRGEGYSHADFVSVTTPSPLRDDTRVRCRYFARCGGCQFQMLDYAEQLRRKRRIVVKAYDNFANLPRALVPDVRDTIASPLQYGYRTKLTPHFDGPPGFRPAKRGKSEAASFSACPDIGFMQKGRRKVMDIEDCPIATEAVRMGNTRERKRMQDEYANYKRGATLLLRENTTRHPKDSEAAQAELAPYTAKSEYGDFVDVKSCETDSKATTTEYIDNYIFTNPAGSFFQNNNSILPVFTSYIRDHILPPAPADGAPAHPIKYLIDAYSGSGLFTITLSSLFQRSVGIDIAGASIEYARRNAALNGLAEDRCRFIAADAAELFRSVAACDPRETVVVLDPPRKGCDAGFLAQLRRLGPRRVLYVSCNVHTQARDVGVLVRGEGEGRRYEIESIVGFDFFPQTGHVEGVAILNRVEEEEEEAEATQN